VHATHVENPIDAVPAGAKLVHQRLAQRGEVWVDDPIFHPSPEGITEKEEIMVSQYGVPREPLGYIWPDDDADPMNFFRAKRFGPVQ
jgi:hypothetical protein